MSIFTIFLILVCVSILCSFITNFFLFMYLAISVDDSEESSNRKKTSNHDKDGIEYSKNIYNLDRNEQTMATVSEEGELLNSASFFLKLQITLILKFE